MFCVNPRQFPRDVILIEDGTHNCEAEEERPETSHGMSLDRLHSAHLVLTVLGIVGIAHEIRVDQDLRLAV